MVHREMSDSTRISYLSSEITVSQTIYAAASRILSAYISSDKVNNENEDIMIDKSVNLTLEMALKTDKIMSQSTTESELIQFIVDSLTDDLLFTGQIHDHQLDSISQENPELISLN